MAKSARSNKGGNKRAQNTTTVPVAVAAGVQNGTLTVPSPITAQPVIVQPPEAVRTLDMRLSASDAVALGINELETAIRKGMRAANDRLTADSAALAKIREEINKTAAKSMPSSLATIRDKQMEVFRLMNEPAADSEFSAALEGDTELSYSLTMFSRRTSYGGFDNKVETRMRVLVSDVLPDSQVSALRAAVSNVDKSRKLLLQWQTKLSDLPHTRRIVTDRLNRILLQASADGQRLLAAIDTGLVQEFLGDITE